LNETNKRSFIVDGFIPERFLFRVFPASEKFDSDLELGAWMHKTDAHPITINIAPMPTQNPWAWVGMGMGMGMGTQCRALVQGGAHMNVMTKAPRCSTQPSTMIYDLSNIKL